MTLSNKILLYTAVLRPILSFASPVWGYVANSSIKILEVAQNSLIRSIVRPGRYVRNALIYRDLKIPAFTPKTYIQKLAKKFYEDIPHTNNLNVIDIQDYDLVDKIKRPRRILLDSYNPPNNLAVHSPVVNDHYLLNLYLNFSLFLIPFYLKIYFYCTHQDASCYPICKSPPHYQGSQERAFSLANVYPTPSVTHNFTVPAEIIFWTPAAKNHEEPPMTLTSPLCHLVIQSELTVSKFSQERTLSQVFHFEGAFIC
ncbi:RNA-directed DNA polymerase from mobile element jockey [Trichonephila clavipes]|uniref:RNA-directed DNA polymerase from mobile element jockey n=1 Tax=Trichonephila clavipes TaxID=2585209 RepID=A0A8X6UYP0_TRICX|nr:RNA-directed DNA polymerase from mobile element jockey [Trichonephila clavipes]